MNCFVDTSAFLAVLGKDDENHALARTAWGDLLEQRATFVTSSYVLAETVAILQHRMGLDAVRVFHHDIYPVLATEWVRDEWHEKGMGSVLAARRRNLSLVDCVSFEVMRQRGIRKAFAFDRHFEEQGFEMIPSTL
jgi:predicted nucleic acid-binding protein